MLSVLHRPVSLGMVRGTAVLLLVVGAAAHLGWLAEVPLDTGLSPLHDVPTRLSVDGVPYQGVFRLAEGLAGVAFVLASPPLLRVAPVHWQGRLTVVSMFVFGALMVARAGFPADCAPTLSPACLTRPDPSPAHRVNAVVSVLLAVQYVAGPTVLALWWHGPWRAAARVVVGIELLAGVLLVLLGTFASWRYTGLAARVQLVAMSALLAVGIGYLITVARDAGRPESWWRRGGRATTPTADGTGASPCQA